MVSTTWDGRYFFHLLFHARLSDLASKTAQPLLTQSVLGAVILPRPDFREQLRIATVLDSIDEAIERTEAVIEAAERLRRPLLQELLTHGVPGWHTEWKQVKGIGTIPADWDVVRLGDVAGVQTGRAVNRKNELGVAAQLPYLSVANVKDGYLDLATVKTMQVTESEIDRYLVKPGDVLFTEGGDADKLGRGCVWNGEIRICLHQNHVFVVRPDEAALVSDFLTMYSGSLRGKAYFLNAAKQTTNLASINSSQLKAMPLPRPSVVEQNEIVSSVGQLSERIDEERNALSAIMALKTSTADELLSGRVRISAGGEAGDG